MPRIPINGVYADGEGNIVVSGNATIYEFKSADPSNPDTVATIYAAETGGSAIPTGIVTTDSNGIYEAWIDDSDYSGNSKFTIILSKSTHTDPPIHFGLPGLSFKDTSETLTNKTLTSPVLTTPQIDDTSEDHQYITAVNELSADRTITLPLLTGNDVFVFEAFIQTLTNKTFTSPKIGTGILDTNGNELLKVTATGSAINEITLANAAIGNNPTLTASGGDTNIGINLVPKGSGNIEAGGNEVATLASFPNYRVGLNCKQASSSTITVEAGEIVVDGVSAIKTTDTTVSLGTAGDWVDNSSERATSTYGYIYINAAGTIELDDVPPDASDTSDNTSGILRYYNTGTDTSWRRMIGWFYMNSTGSGELNSYEVGNLKDGDVSNSIVHTDGTNDTLNDAGYGSDLTNMAVHFYTSGRKTVTIVGHVTFSAFDAGRLTHVEIHDGSDIVTSEAMDVSQSTSAMSLSPLHSENYAQGTFTFDLKGKIAGGGNATVADKTIIVTEN